MNELKTFENYRAWLSTRSRIDLERVAAACARDLFYPNGELDTTSDWGSAADFMEAVHGAMMNLCPDSTTHDKPRVIVLFGQGDFYQAFGDDARLIASLMPCEIREVGDFQVAELPSGSIEKYLTPLMLAGIKTALLEPRKPMPVIFSDEPNNRDRADFARRAMEAYTAAKGGDEPQSELVDLLSDLRHYAAEEGLDFESALGTSEMHFEEEKESGDVEDCEHCDGEFRVSEMLNCPKCGGHGCEECVLAGKCCEAHKRAMLADQMSEKGYSLTDTGGGIEQWLKALGSGYRIISAKDGEPVTDPDARCYVQDYTDGGEETGDNRNFESLDEALRFE